jgi:hypothetical protein
MTKLREPRRRRQGRWFIRKKVVCPRTTWLVAVKDFITYITRNSLTLQIQQLRQAFEQ